MISSPLRYPGGKGRMYNKVLSIIEENNLINRIYVEPFAGGFGIGIKLLTSNNITQAIINDLDYHIYAIWYSIFFKTKKFIELIHNTNIDLNTWEKQKYIYNNYNNYNILTVGFASFFLNRTNYSGVLKGGPIGGKSQAGKYKINCRFNKIKIIEKINKLSAYKDNIEIYNLDVKDFIKKIIIPRRNELFINFDPPYVNKGIQLYQNYYTTKNHIELSNIIINNLQNTSWIMTYDNCKIIKNLYQQYNPENFTLSYFAGKNKKGNELLIKNIV